MSQPLNTVLIGCGKIAVQYGLDQRYRRWYHYATHADVLAQHPHFNWVAAIDPMRKARAAVQKKWPAVAVAPSLTTLPSTLPLLEVAVIATPPAQRLAVLAKLPDSIKALIVEKPLGPTLPTSQQFLDRCRRKRIMVQVNLWRRADKLYQGFAAGKLRRYIGPLQAINIVYDGSLSNTAIHLVDVIEMLAGPITTVQATKNNSGLLQLQSGIIANLLALSPTNYRELTIDFWGSHGRLTTSQEDLHVTTWRTKPHRVLPNAQEIPADQPGRKLSPTVGTAYYQLYTNLFHAVTGTQQLWAPGEVALQAARIIAAIERSAKSGGQKVRV